MTKAKLAILRHGQTEYNKQKRMTGRADIPLTKMGEDQAKQAGKLLNGHTFDAVYSSTLQRAFNTAALAVEHSNSNHHLKKSNDVWHIIAVDDLVETDAGDFTGRFHKKDPEIINHKRDYYTPRPNGESDHDVVTRVGAFYQREILPRLEKGENVLIVCHAGIVRAFDYVLGLEEIPTQKGEKSPKRRIPNATPTIFEYENGQIICYHQLDNPKEIEASKKAEQDNDPKKSDRQDQKPPKFGT